MLYSGDVMPYRKHQVDALGAFVRHVDIQMWPLGRREAAEAAGVTDAQAANWQDRYGLFPAKKQGTGRHATFVFRDVLSLAAVKALMNAGIRAERAVSAVANINPYGTLLHDASAGRLYPGTDFMTPGEDGAWLPVDGPDKAVCVELRVWALFDDVWPRFRKVVMAAPGGLDVSDVQHALDAFRDRLDELRHERWGS